MAAQTTISVPAPDPLEGSLQDLSRQPLDGLCKVALLNSFWDGSLVSNTNLAVEIYFEYFEEQCRLALHNWERCDISSLKLRHLVDISQMLRDRTPRADISSHLRTVFQDSCQEISEEFIDLTVRLLLMIHIGGFRQALIPGQESLVWTDGNLPEALGRYFNCDIVLKDSVDLDRTFTARNLERIGAIRIVWTANLVDHLRMRDDRSVAIFHHASFLHYQKD
jgi:hypothetical protein